MFFLHPTIPSRPGKGQDCDDLDIRASKGMDLGEANVNANNKREEKQRQPKTF